MKVLIIEDEAPAFRRLQKVLEELDASIEIIDVLGTVKDSLKWFKTNPVPDLIFMDIQLSDGLSFEILEQHEVIVPIIFTTAFDEYMLKAFKVNSIDYILKPIKKSDVKEALKKFKSLKSAFGKSQPLNVTQFLEELNIGARKYRSRILIKLKDSLLTVDISEIGYFRMIHGVVYLVNRNDKQYSTEFTLDELTQELDPHLFFRANRQFLVHIDSVIRVHKYFKGKLLLEISPTCDEKVIISTEKATMFKKWLGDI